VANPEEDMIINLPNLHDLHEGEWKALEENHEDNLGKQISNDIINRFHRFYELFYPEVLSNQ
jgi:hypothetical protein